MLQVLTLKSTHPVLSRHPDVRADSVHEDDSTGLNEVDLTSMIHRPPHHHPEIFSQALQLITSLESAPSCNRLATASLIESCQSLEPKDPETQKSLNVGLDRVKSTFAARLAVCELRGAHAAVPQQCLPLVPQKPVESTQGVRCFFPGNHCNPSSKHRSAQRPEHEDVSQQDISHCLTALESRPQWWTSYSNARQNAISICHAARAEIEKGKCTDFPVIWRLAIDLTKSQTDSPSDEILQLQRSLVDVGSNVNQALSQSAERANTHATEHQRFLTAVRRLQTDLLRDLQKSEGKVQSVFDILLRNMDHGIANVFGAFSQKADEANLRLDKINLVMSLPEGSEYMLADDESCRESKSL